MRRIDGRSLGRFFADEFATPLELEAWIGLPESEESRVGKVILGPGMVPWDCGLTKEQKSDQVLRAVRGNPPLFPVGEMFWNTPACHSAEIASSAGIASARAMARYYGCMSMGGELNGVRVLKPETVALGRSELSRFMDPYFVQPMAFGLIWMLQTPRHSFGPPADAFGHTGAGGSVHAAWPTEQVGFSYTMNEMRADPEEQRTRSPLACLKEAVGKTTSR